MGGGACAAALSSVGLLGMGSCTYTCLPIPLCHYCLQSDVPGIISFFDAFYAENSVHIVLEYMDRGSLAAVLSRRGPLPGDAFGQCHERAC